MKLANTLGELKKTNYTSKTIKQELRDNLIKKIKNNEKIFDEIYGYENTVIPELQRAILSGHHINLLGLRGQAKTKIARQLVNLLDEYIPVIANSPLNDCPLNPISNFAKKLIEEHKDQTPITWLKNTDRFAEKLATPDVSIADIIGDIDPIKAANLKLSYAHEEVIHYGMIPRSNRFIFVINELPDLQARIQVALFNILQESDIQIRGFNIRIPLDMQFVFTANPEDYTNRGSIVTPLKDRIGSQILTHYPKNIDIAKSITISQAKLSTEQKEIANYDLLATLIEEVAIEARTSEFVDSKSGVSARLTISAYESLMSTAQLRFLQNKMPFSFVRISDLYGIIPAVNGKIELVYEGEQEGTAIVASNLIGKAIRKTFSQYFPNPTLLKKNKQENVYAEIILWFNDGNTISLLEELNDEDYLTELNKVSGLKQLVKNHLPKLKNNEQLLFMEFTLHSLAEYSLINKQLLQNGMEFSDLLTSMLSQKNSN